jgi:FtsZ-binding cell division protein ZapB
MEADASSTSLTNASAIGYTATVATSNTMAFGNSSVTAWAFGRSSVATGSYALQVGSGSSNGGGAYLTAAGVWTNISDRNKKENFTALDSKEILNRIMRLPVTQWNYKGDTITNIHIGPMAQDFYKLFHTGGDSLAISTIDPAGVALVGVQELKKENDELKKENEDMKLQLQKLNNENSSLKTTTDKLTTDVAEIKDMLKNNTTVSADKSGTTLSKR